MSTPITRREALFMIAASVPCAVACNVLSLPRGSTVTSGPTPTCAFTVDNPEGPFYLRDAPFRTKIAPDDMAGQRLFISGTVTDCERPLPDAIVDVWQASPEGRYDMGPDYLLRGRVRAGADGSYNFETVLPGNYGNRPAHIHYRISHSQAQTLITQLYFVGDPHNEADRLVRPSLIIPLEETEGALYGVFDIGLQPL